jgi:hypothetical protein
MKEPVASKAISITSNVPTVAHLRFEHDLPAGCPPKDAISGPKLLYRLVTGRPPGADDFRTTREEGTFKNGDPCQRCSISTQASIEGARALRAAIPNLAERMIAQGTVPAGAGNLKPTPRENNPDHWSWWPTMGISRHTLFEVIDEAA